MYDTVENVFSQGEKLQKIGLNIPQVTKIFIELKQRGIDVPQNVFTLDKAEQILFKLFKKEGVQ